MTVVPPAGTEDIFDAPLLLMRTTSAPFRAIAYARPEDRRTDQKSSVRG
jgi:hypothetical protein